MPKSIMEMTDEEVEEMVSDEMKESERRSSIIDYFVKELFPNSKVVGYEFNTPKGWIKIKFKNQKME